MGDIEPSTRRRGIALVRPKLHEDTPENRGLFKRWTKLHTRDVLSIPKDADLGGISKLLRYKRSENGGEEYLYTIHFDDIKLLTTVPFQKVSRRLDLENTRPLGPGEEAVLQAGDERQGTEPMVTSIVGPTSGMFEVVDESKSSPHHGNSSYQDLSAEFATNADAPNCTLITLTINTTYTTPKSTQYMQKLQSSLANFLATASQDLLYTSLYHHAPDAQPEKYPFIPDGQHGKGDWVICALVMGNADKQLAEAGLQDVEGQVEEWYKRARIDGSLEGMDVKVGAWKGDVFMS